MLTHMRVPYPPLPRKRSNTMERGGSHVGKLPISTSTKYKLIVRGQPRVGKLPISTSTKYKLIVRGQPRGEAPHLNLN